MLGVVRQHPRVLDDTLMRNQRAEVPFKEKRRDTKTINRSRTHRSRKKRQRCYQFETETKTIDFKPAKNYRLNFILL